MGIRGTSLFMAWDPKQQGYFMGLLGPGPRNNVSSDAGGFVFTDVNGNTLTVLRQGYGIIATENGNKIIRTPSRLIALLQQQFTAGRGLRARVLAARSGGRSASAQSGQTDAAGRTVAGGQANINGELTETNESTFDASEDTNNDLIRNGPRVIFNPGEGGPKDSDNPTPIQIVTPLDNILPTQSIAVNQGVGRLSSGITLPYAVQASWNNPAAEGTFFDINVHLTGPLPAGGRFHVYFDDVGSFESTPFALHDADAFGATASEVIGISQLTPGDVYRTSGFSFSNAGANSTVLANDSNVVLTLLQNGVISRGPGGSAVINGTTLATARPPADVAGNTFVGFEFDPMTLNVTLIEQITNNANAADVQ